MFVLSVCAAFMYRYSKASYVLFFVYALLIFAQLEFNTICMSETRGANLIALLLLFSHTHTHRQIRNTHTQAHGANEKTQQETLTKAID